MLILHYFNKIIFVITIICTNIFALTLIFPNFIIGITLPVFPENFSEYEFGIISIPMIVANIVFLFFLILQKKQLLPESILRVCNVLKNRDISKKTAFVILFCILTAYVAFALGEFSQEEYEFGDYVGVKESAENWKKEFEGGLSLSPALRYFFLFLSLEYLGSIRILPFIASIGLLILVYFITKEISGKRISGIFAFMILIQSNLFLLYDTTSTYENFWIFFYFLSLYLIIKQSSMSSISYFISLLLKPIVVLFMPINFFYAFFIEDKRKKIKVMMGFLIITGIILIAFFTGELKHAYIDNTGFNYEKFVLSFNEISNALRFDNIILIIFVPVVILLYLQQKNRNSKGNFILFGILFTLLSQPLLYSVIEMTIQPYRFIPLIIFMAIGFGTICSGNNQESLSKSDRM